MLPVGRVRLTPRERIRLGAEIVRTYVAVRWWLLRRGLPGAIVAARRTEETRPVLDEPSSRAAALRLGRSVERTLGALPFDSRCLIQSLVLVRILARRGVPSTMVIGVMAQPRFSAHAWVEHGGVALLPAGSRFHRLAEM